MFGLASCANADQSSVTLSDVAKTVEVGDKFDLTATSADGSDLTWTVDSNIVTLSAETSKSGEAINVTAARVGTAKVVAEAANGKSAECVVTVNEASATVTSIEITTPPTKTKYAVGEELDLTGLVVEAYYSNQTHRTLAANEYTVSGFSSATENKKVVCTVTYEGKTATFNVRVGDGPNVAVCYGLAEGGETSIANDRGKLYRWSSGDEGSSFSYAAQTGPNEFKFTYVTGWMWYSVQFFYSLPYMNAGDHYDLSLKLKATVSGKVTVNSQEVDLVANTAKEVKITNGTVASTQSVIGMQLGANTGGNGTPLPAGTIIISDVVVHDLTNDYNEVSYVYHGDTSTEYIKTGSTIYRLPPDMPDEGDNIFVGWLDANGSPLTSTTVINEDATFTATFLPESQVTKRDVKIYKGSDVIQTIKVIDGRTLDISKINNPFGYTLAGLYTDSARTVAFNVTTPITANTDLYGKFNVTYSSTWINDAGAGWVLNPDLFSNEADGALHLQGLGVWVDGLAYYMQVNFALPAGDSGVVYTVEFDYKINLNGGSVQLYDSTQVDSSGLTASSNYQHVTLHYTGTRGGNLHIEFDLGAVTASGDITTIDLLINNLSLTH